MYRISLNFIQVASARTTEADVNIDGILIHKVGGTASYFVITLTDWRNFDFDTMMQHAVRPQSVVSYAPPHPAFPHHAPGNDIYAHLAWLEEQRQLHFNQSAIMFDSNLKLCSENAHLTQEQGLLQKQITELRAEKQQLLTENQRLVEVNLRAEQHTTDSEHQRALIQKLKAKVAAHQDEIQALKDEAKGNSIESVCCFNDCRMGRGVSQLTCSECFMPAKDVNGRNRKGSTKVRRHNLSTVSVSDSDEAKPISWHDYRDSWITKTNTRLDDGLFNWLVDYCLDNSDKIERQRVRERNENGHTVRRLIEDLRDVEDEIRKGHERLAGKKMRKRQLKRKLIVLTDEAAVVTADESNLEGKLYTFCSILSQPQHAFYPAYFPKLNGDKLLTERDAVK
jgi:hypothetical protein